MDIKLIICLICLGASCVLNTFMFTKLSEQFGLHLKDHERMAKDSVIDFDLDKVAKHE